MISHVESCLGCWWRRAAFVVGLLVVLGAPCRAMQVTITNTRTTAFTFDLKVYFQPGMVSFLYRYVVPLSATLVVQVPAARVDFVGVTVATAAYQAQPLAGAGQYPPIGAGIHFTLTTAGVTGQVMEGQIIQAVGIPSWEHPYWEGRQQTSYNLDAGTVALWLCFGVGMFAGWVVLSPLET